MQSGSGEVQKGARSPSKADPPITYLFSVNLHVFKIPLHATYRESNHSTYRLSSIQTIGGGAGRRRGRGRYKEKERVNERLSGLPV